MSSLLDPIGLFDSSSTDTMPDSNPGMIASAYASRDAAIAQSNAQVQMSQSQAATMQLGILKSSQDAQFQTLAWLTTQLDSNDSKMQIAVENAKLSAQQESDHHTEAMQGLKNDARQQEIDSANLDSQLQSSQSAPSL